MRPVGPMGLMAQMWKDRRKQLAPGRPPSDQGRGAASGDSGSVQPEVEQYPRSQQQRSGCPRKDSETLMQEVLDPVSLDNRRMWLSSNGFRWELATGWMVRHPWAITVQEVKYQQIRVQRFCHTLLLQRHLTFAYPFY